MWNVLTALNHMHGQDPPILHRDLKPENLLLFDKERVKITDFGWSAEYNDVRNTFCGTQEYLSPEMIKGTGHDEKLDVWTLGVLVYELIHGRTPFFHNVKGVDIRTQRRMIEKLILAGKFEIEESLQPSTKEAIIAMLQPDKNKRPTTKQLMQFEFFRKAINPMSKSKSMKLLQNQENISMKEVQSLRVKVAELQKENKSLGKEKLSLATQLKRAKNSDLLIEIRKLNTQNGILKGKVKIFEKERRVIQSDLDFAEKELRGVQKKLTLKNSVVAKSEKSQYLLKESNKLMLQKSKVDHNS